MKKFIISLFLLLILYGCGRITPIDIEQFQKIMTNNNLTTSDITNNYQDSVLIKYAFEAKENDNYVIQFVKATEEENAVTLFNMNKNNVEKQYKYGAYTNGTVSDINSVKFTLKNNDLYFYIIQVDDTLLYASAKKDYEKTIKKIIKELGY